MNKGHCLYHKVAGALFKKKKKKDPLSQTKLICFQVVIGKELSDNY